MKSLLSKSIIILYSLILLCYFFFLNHFTPLWHDEYLYSFIFGTNERVNSFSDILHSQYNLYNWWTGRNIVHFIIQFFIWIGKGYFNVINALMFVVLILLIIKFSTERKVFSKDNLPLLLITTILCWFGLPEFGETTIWLGGSVNYLWTSVLVLYFLLPFKNLLQGNNRLKDNTKNVVIMISLGIICGWSQENASFVSVLFVTLCFIYLRIKKVIIPKWFYSGTISVILGFIILISAPGNFSRANRNSMTTEQLIKNWLGSFKAVVIEEKYILLILVLLFFIALLLFFSKRIKKHTIPLILLGILFITAFSSYIIMVASPEFPKRAAFIGGVLLIVCINLLLDSTITKKGLLYL
ncbi:DUF6056 family protein, partial [Paenibacillus elgii]